MGWTEQGGTEQRGRAGHNRTEAKKQEREGKAPATAGRQRKLCRDMWQGQGLGQGQGQGLYVYNTSGKRTHRCGVEALGVVVVALQGVSVVAGQTAGGSWVGVHCHILLTCIYRQDSVSLKQHFCSPRHGQ